MKRAILSYVNNYPKFKEFLTRILDCGNIYFVGGAVRAFIENRNFDEEHDFDIAIDITNREKFEELLVAYTASGNKFGGSKIVIDNHSFDVWPIEDTWAFKAGLVEFDRDDFVNCYLKTVFLSTDAVIYDWSHDYLEKSGYDNTMLNSVLDVVLPENPNMFSALAKAIAVENKYSLCMSNRLTNVFYDNVCIFADLIESIRYLCKLCQIYGLTEEFTRSRIFEICNQKSYKILEGGTPK